MRASFFLFGIHIITMKGSVTMIDFNKLLTTNPEITHAFHGKIMECDMREASLQISDVFNLLPKDTINELHLLPKEERVIKVGLIQKGNQEFSDSLFTKLKEVRKHFIDINKIVDEEVISLHSDAIFINTKKPLKLIIDGIEFKIKHKWTSYIRYNNIEMLYDGDTDSIVYKGISSNVLKFHTIGLCQHILKVFQMIENNDELIFNYLADYQSKYLSGQLNPNCYKPFGQLNGDIKYNLKFLAYLCNIAIKEVG